MIITKAPLKSPTIVLPKKTKDKKPYKSIYVSENIKIGKPFTLLIRVDEESGMCNIFLERVETRRIVYNSVIKKDSIEKHIESIKNIYGNANVPNPIYLKGTVSPIKIEASIPKKNKEDLEEDLSLDSLTIKKKQIHRTLATLTKKIKEQTISYFYGNHVIEELDLNSIPVSINKSIKRRYQKVDKSYPILLLPKVKFVLESEAFCEGKHIMNCYIGSKDVLYVYNYKDSIVYITDNPEDLFK